MEFSSARIKFVPITVELAQTIMKNPLGFYYKYRLPWNKSWPHDGLKAMLPFYAEALEKDSQMLGFGPWIMIDVDQELVIGDIGFKGPPDEEGVIEVGYHVVENERNKGYATEAVRAMCEWGFSHDKVCSIEAQCGKRNVPSQKVLINNGFSQTLVNRDMFTFEKKKQKRNNKKSEFNQEM
ncbi:GNAT family N-acetyltransferase [Halobacillus campisalis]|uniref:GNAT family N-acetyltransferase n=1 Tax=Halobacillus campisalis TaxID=435909 RepID=A0ABW2K5J8_9BACI|nr:GNAT family N-acetyltransferase [Halobacillus campisalis]